MTVSVSDVVEVPAVVRRIQRLMHIGENPRSGATEGLRQISNVVRVELDGAAPVDEWLVAEEPLEIRLLHGPTHQRSERPISVTMRTPGHDFELAAGFLLSEGVIRDADDITSIELAHTSSEGNAVRVTLAPDVEVNAHLLERNFYTTSSCGICGKASLLALRVVCPPHRENCFSLSNEAIRALPEKLRSRQSLFDRTGGLHGAALVDAGGNIFRTREDVGRHNAVDKLTGCAALAGELPLRHYALLLSGRASFELLQKAVMAGIPMVIAVGAPSSLAVAVAREFDITLVGFLRPDHFNIYNGAERLCAQAASASV